MTLNLPFLFLLLNHCLIKKPNNNQTKVKRITKTNQKKKINNQLTKHKTIKTTKIQKINSTSPHKIDCSCTEKKYRHSICQNAKKDHLAQQTLLKLSENRELLSSQIKGMIRKTGGACSQRGCPHRWIHAGSQGTGNSGSHAGKCQLLPTWLGVSGQDQGVEWNPFLLAPWSHSLLVLFAMDLVVSVKLRMHENPCTVVGFVPVHLVRRLRFISLLPHCFQCPFWALFFSFFFFNNQV